LFALETAPIAVEGFRRHLFLFLFVRYQDAGVNSDHRLDRTELSRRD
jgi:hypothetical protein